MVTSDLRPVNDRVKKTVLFHSVRHDGILGNLYFILMCTYAGTELDFLTCLGLSCDCLLLFAVWWFSFGRVAVGGYCPLL